MRKSNDPMIDPRGTPYFLDFLIYNHLLTGILLIYRIGIKPVIRSSLSILVFSTEFDDQRYQKLFQDQ